MTFIIPNIWTNDMSGAEKNEFPRIIKLLKNDSEIVAVSYYLPPKKNYNLAYILCTNSVRLTVETVQIRFQRE